MTRCPTGPQFEALTLLAADSVFVTELPRAILNQCIEAGWVHEDNNGFASITREGQQERRARNENSSFPRGWKGWLTEPAVGRVADGVPSRVDRLKALGNAVVPQIPEMIGYAILQAESAA